MKNFSYLRDINYNTFVNFVDLHFAKCLKHKKRKSTQMINIKLTVLLWGHGDEHCIPGLYILKGLFYIFGSFAYMHKCTACMHLQYVQVYYMHAVAYMYRCTTCVQLPTCIFVLMEARKGHEFPGTGFIQIVWTAMQILGIKHRLSRRVAKCS